MQTHTWSLDSLPDSVGYESNRDTPSISPSECPRNRVQEPVKVDVGVQAEGVSDMLYIRNLKMLQSEIDEKERLLEEAVGLYKRQEWNIECLRKGLRQETHENREIARKVLQQVHAVEALLWALREETAEIVKDRGLETTESLRRILEMKDEARLKTWLQQTIFPTERNILADISPPTPVTPELSAPPPPLPTHLHTPEATCNCAIM